MERNVTFQGSIGWPFEQNLNLNIDFRIRDVTHHRKLVILGLEFGVSELNLINRNGLQLGRSDIQQSEIVWEVKDDESPSQDLVRVLEQHSHFHGSA